MENVDFCTKTGEAIAGFRFDGEYITHKPFGSGHINDTFLINTAKKDYILQRINSHVFKNPDRLMENVVSISDFLNKKAKYPLAFMKARNGKYFHIDSGGSYWRAYEYISGTKVYEKAESGEQMLEAGKAFGNFQKLLHDYPISKIHETIPDFHNTKLRYQRLICVAKADVMRRAQMVVKELKFIEERASMLDILMQRRENNELRLRVTHNDTKINNVLFHKKTGDYVCVIDLDTVMPGLVAYDFGDSIRSGCNAAAEDETNLSRVKFNKKYYYAFQEGFLSECGDILTKGEVVSLPLGARLMTLECGIRFLTDFLEGDKYFKISQENHNLNRCRVQLKLASEMEKELIL